MTASRLGRLGAVISIAMVLGVMDCGGSERGKTLAPSASASSGSLGDSLALAPVDILIFAPHPDDEVLGCAAVIQRAVAAGKKVRVVFATSGDGFAQSAAVLFNKDEAALVQADYVNLAKARQEEALEADRALGVNPADLVFLGYPDGALDRVAADTDTTPATSPTTGRSSTYGIAVPDYHTRAHGQPAPYTRAAVLADLAEVLTRSRPSAIYVTDEKDTHLDHATLHQLVAQAMVASSYRGTVLTFVVHGGPPWEWPWPRGLTPQLPFQQHASGAATYPAGMPWPPPVRVQLTEAEVTVKLRALSAHRSQWNLPLVHDLLSSFIKSEEIFWTGR